MSPQTTSLRKRFQTLPWWVVLLVGIASLVVGALLIVSPRTAITDFFRIAGAASAIGGAVTIIRILSDRRAWGWKLFGGIIAIVVGLLLLVLPLGSAYLASAFVVWLVGTMALLGGVGLIVLGVAFARWRYTVGGILAFAFGGLVILTMALSSLVVIPLLFGIGAVAVGALAIREAFRMRVRGRTPMRPA